MKFISFDFETTGLKSQSSNIIELAFLKFSDGIVVDKLVSLVKPPELIPSKITNLTGISDSMVIDAPSFSTIAPQISKFIGNDLLVAYNAPFDKGFLNVGLYRNKIHSHYNLFVCALILTQKVFNLSYMPKLSQAISLFGWQVEDSKKFHRAEFDAYYAGKILIESLIRLNWTEADLLALAKPLKIDKPKN